MFSGNERKKWRVNIKFEVGLWLEEHDSDPSSQNPQDNEPTQELQVANEAQTIVHVQKALSVDHSTLAITLIEGANYWKQFECEFEALKWTDVKIGIRMLNSIQYITELTYRNGIWF